MSVLPAKTNLRAAANALGFVQGDSTVSKDLVLRMIAGQTNELGTVTLSIMSDGKLQAVYAFSDAAKADGWTFTAAHLAASSLAESPPFAPYLTGYGGNGRGVAKIYTISGAAFVDANGDGKRQGTEVGLEGVTVTLSGDATATATSGSGGGFSFSNLDAGSYAVTAGQMSGYTIVASSEAISIDNTSVTNANFAFVPVPANSGGSSSSGGGGSPTGGQTSGGGSAPSGGSASSGGSTSSDGGNSGNPIPGKFPGQWTGSQSDPVTVVIDLGDLAGGGDFYVAAHASMEQVKAGAIVASASSWTPDIPFKPDRGNWGTYTRVSVKAIPEPHDISGFAYRDRNENKAMEQGEPGIAGVEMSLLDSKGAVAAKAATGADGSYVFKDVLQGNYTVTSGAADGFYRTTSIGDGSLAVAVSGADVSNVDFGYSFRSVSVVAYYDKNGDGRYVPADGDSPLAGVPVSFSPADLKGRSSASSGSGSATLDNFDKKAYSFAAGAMPGYFKVQNEGGATIDFSQLAWDAAPVVYFGYSYRTISGTVYWDDNNNDALDGSDYGLDGFTVSIAGVGEVRTSGGGKYAFHHLMKQAYSVSVPDRAGYYHTGASSRSVDVTAGDKSGVDFGYVYRSVSGFAFFDANGDKAKSNDQEYGMGGVRVSAGGASVTTNADGSYAIDHLPPQALTVVGGDLANYSHTSPAAVSVDLGARNGAVNFGYALSVPDLRLLPAPGFSQGYWKTNLDKAIKGQTNGVQVAAATLQAYVDRISGAWIDPFSTVSTLKAASAVLSSTSPAGADLLAKQLLAAEFNFMNGAFFGSAVLGSGDRALTSAFVYQGEYILAHPGEFSSAQVSQWQGYYDQFNNTHGGTMAAPLP